MELDIYSLGNAIVDVQFGVKDEFKKYLEEMSISFGTMTLIERKEQKNLINLLKSKYGEPMLACGGSATNSIFASSSFGSKCHLTCKVRNDNMGNFYLRNLKSNNILHNKSALDEYSELPTGQSVIMVTPDAERTMCTFLGISNTLNKSDLDKEVLKRSKYLFIEGYLVTSPSSLSACQEAIKIATANNTKVAISLSDPNIADIFRAELKSLIEIKCDLLFCNELEALSFSQTKSLKEGEDYLKSLSSSTLITLHEKGCILLNNDSRKKIQGLKTKAIDTNGAGDMFAGAVLHSVIEENNLHKAALFGCYAASKKVENFGPRLSKKQYKEIKETFL